jgi:DNA-directed RNA polymerase subunit M/transcription elongation factor TFIIS
MALPKLNSMPSYDATIPSTKQSVTFRPFVVKEQKNLLIALETQDKKGLVRAMKDTITACVNEPIKGELTTFDVDYLFTQIRAKSVGETTELVFVCENCEHQNQHKIDLTDITVTNEVADNKIVLSNEITVKLRYPTYEDFLNNPKLLEPESVTETLIELIMVCMDSVLTEEERIIVKDEPREAVIEFLESMTTAQFNQLSEFVQNIPAVTKQVDFTCASCGTENQLVLRGLDDFF